MNQEPTENSNNIVGIISLIERLADVYYEMIKDSVCELVLDFENLRTYEDIAMILLPDEWIKNSSIATSIIKNIVYKLQDECLVDDKILNTRRSLFSSRSPGSFANNASLRIKVGQINSERSRRQLTSWHEDQGHNIFSSEELELIENLCNKAEYQHIRGPHKGRPNYDLISQEVNRNFWNDEPVRTSRGIMNKRKTLKYESKKANGGVYLEA